MQPLHEEFRGPALHPALRWRAPPAAFRLENGRLVVEPDEKTDYWQQTHYGFRVDNGPFLHLQAQGDLVLTTRVRSLPVHRYDQAGLLVRFSPTCWLKTSVEFIPGGPNRLGAVVTNHGFSDWSTQPFGDGPSDLYLRIRRESGDYLVEWLAAATEESLDPAALRAQPWTQLRMAHLAEDEGDPSFTCGLYACSPQGRGYRALFDFLLVEPGRL
ncbi:DUF1349 domain-containing protein [Vulgatibacter sp.]|uniref:DUF1349 domain-containing protein n=1 Tax=Vulgatibacter sp. TaxID=1971226 RepID=UPI0035694D1A